MNDVLRSVYFESNLDYDNVDWFVDEVINLEFKVVYHFKNTNKDITMTQEDEKNFKKKIVCRFGEKTIERDKVRDHCHLTGKNRGPAQSKCNTNVTQKRSSFIHLNSTISVNMIVIYSSRNSLIKRMIK